MIRSCTLTENKLCLQDLAERLVPDGYMYKDIMRVLAECGRFEQAIEIMHQMYEITQREDIHQFGESQLATLAGHMVGHMHTPTRAKLLLLPSGLMQT